MIEGICVKPFSPPARNARITLTSWPQYFQSFDTLRGACSIPDTQPPSYITPATLHDFRQQIALFQSGALERRTTKRVVRQIQKLQRGQTRQFAGDVSYKPNQNQSQCSPHEKKKKKTQRGQKRKCAGDVSKKPKKKQPPPPPKKKKKKKNWH